jgi:hypothetical protein
LQAARHPKLLFFSALHSSSLVKTRHPGENFLGGHIALHFPTLANTKRKLSSLGLLQFSEGATHTRIQMHRVLSAALIGLLFGLQIQHCNIKWNGLGPAAFIAYQNQEFARSIASPAKSFL